MPWKKGESGNPAGRPKGSLSLVTLLKHKLEEIDPGDSDGRTYAERIVAEYVERMRTVTNHDGETIFDTVAFRDMMDRTDGKPRQDHKIEGSFEVHFDKGDEDY